MRIQVFAAGLALLAACSPPTTTATTQTGAARATAPMTVPPWLICDGLDAPVLLLFIGGPDGATASLTQYTKPTGATAGPAVTYELGESEGAAGSVFTPLRLNGQDAGNVRAANPAMLETPGTAYTTPYTFVTLGEKQIACRWMPRTRLMGFTGRRTIVVSEDADGDLIYTTYDFAAAQRAIDTSDNGHTSTFSVEVRGGSEQTSSEGVIFDFSNNGYRYHLSALNGRAEVQVFHGGDQPIQTEPLIAFQLGQAAQTAN